MIARNTHNPIPLHRSIGDWYDRKPTYKGAFNAVFAPNGYLLPMQLTLNQSECPTLDVLITFSTDSRATHFTGNIISANESTILADTNGRQVILTRNDGGYYTMKYGENGTTIYNMSLSSTSATKTNMMENELRRTDTRRYYMYDGNAAMQGYIEVSQSMLSPQLSISAKLVRVNDSSETNVTIVSYVDVVPLGMRKYERYAATTIGGCNIAGNKEDGLYYLAFELDGHTYYTEPFFWLTDMSKFVHITYRRTSPINTSTNYIPFKCNGKAVNMEMYVRSVIAKPPFKFESEVKDADGYKFVQKQVSYVSESFNFLCSSYFADALRMMWHCDSIIYTYDGEIKSVDYMEAPEPNWNTDTHLCEVSIVFQTDTIMQTNGDARMPISASGEKWSSSKLPAELKSYTSFNKAYNEDYK